jgi:hypothetical protein
MVAAYDRRLAELQAKKYLNPGHIIERYREIAGLPPGRELPRGVSFSRMLEMTPTGDAAVGYNENAAVLSAGRIATQESDYG